MSGLPHRKAVLVGDSADGESRGGETLRRDIKAALYIETSAAIVIPDDVEAVLPKIARVAMAEEKLGVLGMSGKCCLVM
ncbi:hypothetical protein AMAG_20485 [Allomyces macrogynus ATCC 38327]|uniref:Uncharacterized protein n=1 Tax=Allomyces macrogynus (strain ATCC 38327) TaxID=578462 RepID=A0A0L0TD07_ALLM3|nr:hypothetical protein AMAG_20485 [Allomyces macrogynus ATCC 38327]|eukprot:KNE72622.1 hypothetical protein AMAG_20485 [Allomyces macrogynus ATCC 38327]